MNNLPHNPFKLPLYVFGAVMGVVFIVGALSGAPVWLAAVGVVALLLSGVGLRAISQGRNPWYTRSPLDRVFARKSRR